MAATTQAQIQIAVIGALRAAREIQADTGLWHSFYGLTGGRSASAFCRLG